MLETERTRLSAEDSLATARASRLTSLISLYKALGGGWDASAPSSPGKWKIMNDTADKSRDALLGILNAAPKGVFRGGRRRWLLIGGGLVLLLVLWAVFSFGGKNAGGQYVTEEATLGNLVVSVSASGTLQPTKSIDVGSEQSGTLASVLAQENDYVKKGQLLAQLDSAKLSDAVAKSRAALAAANASVALAQATVAETKAALARMQRVAGNFRRQGARQDRAGNRRSRRVARQRQRGQCPRLGDPGAGRAENRRNQSRQGHHQGAGRWCPC